MRKILKFIKNNFVAGPLGKSYSLVRNVLGVAGMRPQNVRGNTSLYENI